MSTPKSENEEREQRILDAASDLIVHYGFDKTTVSDIAREAGISKGAIYLHFESKDDLFEGLLISEMTSYTSRWLDLLEADPNGGTIGAMYKNSLYALNESPFMSAIFKQDSRVLGSYIRKPNNIFTQGQEHDTRYIFVKMMQDAGAIRTDIDARVVSHVMDMLAFGLVSMEEIKKAEFIPSTDSIIEGIALIMDTALTPENADKNAGKVVLNQLVNTIRQEFEENRKEKEE